MFAGEFGMQTEILHKVIPIVLERIAAEPEKWWSVSEVAHTYAKLLQQCHLKRSENAILAPLGLDMNSFLAKQRGMDSDLVKQIASRLAQFESPGVEAIFCGLDATGAHIYIVNNSANVICHDVVGFAAIGAGYWHADSQFMFANHTREKSFPETLLLTYSAKKRAEVAPGVGADTDMFIIGPGLGQHIPIVGNHVLEQLQKTYEKTQIKKGEVDKEAQVDVGRFLDELSKKSAEKKQQETVLTSPAVSAPPPSELPPK